MYRLQEHGQLVQTLGLQWPEERKVKEDSRETKKDEALKEEKSAATGGKSPDKRRVSFVAPIVFGVPRSG